MGNKIMVFEVIKSVMFWTSPALFIVGLLLLIAEYKYRKLEEILGKEIGGIRKIVIPKLEATIYTFQERLLNRRIIVGSILIIFSILFFIIFR